MTRGIHDAERMKDSERLTGIDKQSHRELITEKQHDSPYSTSYSETQKAHVHNL